MSGFLSKKEYGEIAKLFNLGVVKSISHFYKGLRTPKVLMKTSRGNFVVSKHKLSERRGLVNKSIRSLQYEIDLLNHLKSLPVPRYIKSLKGKYVENFRNNWITVYKYIPGKSPQVITPKKAYQLGRFLGKFHKYGKNFHKILKTRRRFYDLNTKTVSKMYPIIRRQRNRLLKSIIDTIKNGVEKHRPPRGLPHGPIHVDIKPENELFIGNRLSGIVDFGNFYIGPYVVDIGKTIMWNCIRYKKLNQKLVKQLLRGYTSIRSLKREERIYIKDSVLFAIYSHIWVDLYHTYLGYVPENYTLSLVDEFLPINQNEL